MNGTADDWLLLGLAVAAALTFAASLIRSRTFGEVTWVVHTTRKARATGAVRVLIDMSNAGSVAAHDVSVWTMPHPTGSRRELSLSKIRAGQDLAVELDVPDAQWDHTWLEIRWRSPRGRRRTLATSYHLATRTPPCAGSESGI